MSTKERNSSVPLGTFGASEPPPPPTRRDSSPSDPGDRPSNKSTLVGHPSPTGSLAPGAGSQAPRPDGRRSSVPNTLVGHPLPTDPAALAAGPFPAPPKWQGARAYEGQEQPELQVGHGSQPPATEEPSEPVAGAADAGEPAAAVPVPQSAGLPAPPPTTASASADAEENPPPGAAGRTERNLDDSIQRMLDEQAAVPIEVEEPGGGDIELSASDIEIEGVLASARLKAPVISTPPPTPTSASGAPARPRDHGVAPRRAPQASAGEASLAPAEVSSQAPDDSNAGLGILMVAAVFVIGVGGWLLTQGSYQRPQTPASVAAEKAQATAATAPEPEAPAAPTVTEPAPAAQEAPRPATDQTSAEGKAAPTPVRAPKRVAPAARKKPAPRLARTPAAEPAAPPPEEPKLKPVDAYPTQPRAAVAKPKRVAPELLPDTPSRADVLAALEPMQAAVTACAKGQRGVAEVDITVQSTGQVSHAVVRGDFAGTPEGSCIARTVRGAAFGPFKQPRFRVVYPFAL